MPCKNIAPNALNWQYCTLKAVLYSKVKPLVELTFEGVDDKIEELVLTSESMAAVTLTGD